jgi:hypothetical protein
MAEPPALAQQQRAFAAHIRGSDNHRNENLR